MPLSVGRINDVIIRRSSTQLLRELKRFGRVLITPVFSIINVPFVLLVHTRQKIVTITKMRAKTVFQAGFAWPNCRNNQLLHVSIFPSTIITSKGQKSVYLRYLSQTNNLSIIFIHAEQKSCSFWSQTFELLQSCIENLKSKKS